MALTHSDLNEDLPRMNTNEFHSSAVPGASEIFLRLGAAIQRACYDAHISAVLEEFASKLLDTLVIGIGRQESKRADNAVSHDARVQCVERITQLFRAINQVSEIRLKVDGKDIRFHVFVVMPKYDDALMDALIDAEIHGERIAREEGYQVDFRYYPLPQVTPESLGLDKVQRV